MSRRKLRQQPAFGRHGQPFQLGDAAPCDGLLEFLIRGVVFRQTGQFTQIHSQGFLPNS